MDKAITRREFIRSNSALAGFFILPSGLLANSPNGRLTSSHIGIGGKGASRRVWAATLTRRSSKTIPKCSPRWATRSTLCLSRPQTPDPRPQTPDHIHYPATMAAMQLGKHVYTQKLLTNNIAEARCPDDGSEKTQGVHADGHPEPVIDRLSHGHPFDPGWAHRQGQQGARLVV